MDMPKPKRGCEIKVEAVDKFDLNKGDDEKFKSNKYMANPEKGFLDAIKKRRDKK